ALGRLGAERHATIQPHGHVGRATAQLIATEARRDLDGDLEVAAAEPAIELLAGADRRWHFVEVAPARRERLDQASALGGAILIESAKAQVFDIERNAIAEGDHENEWAEQGECQSDRVAQKLHRLAPGIGP